MQSVNRFIPDAAFAIRAAGAAALTADTLLNAGLLATPVGAIWDAEPAHGKVVFFVKTDNADEASMDETYALTVVTSANADLSSAQSHDSIVVTAAEDGKWQEILVDTETLVKNDPDALYFGLLVDVGGTTPSIEVEAYVLPPVGK